MEFRMVRGKQFVKMEYYTETKGLVLIMNEQQDKSGPVVQRRYHRNEPDNWSDLDTKDPVNDEGLISWLENWIWYFKLHPITGKVFSLEDRV